MIQQSQEYSVSAFRDGFFGCVDNNWFFCRISLRFGHWWVNQKFFKFDFLGCLVTLTFFGSTSNLVYSLNQALSHHFNHRRTSILAHTLRTVPSNEFVPRPWTTMNNSTMSRSGSPIWAHCSGRASNYVDCRIFLNHLKPSSSSIGILVGLTSRFSALHPFISFRVQNLTAVIHSGRPHVVMTKLERNRIPFNCRCGSG